MQSITNFLTDLAIDSNKMDAYVKDPKVAYELAGLTNEEIELLETGNSPEIVKALLKSGDIDDIARFTTTRQTHTQTNIRQLAEL